MMVEILEVMVSAETIKELIIEYLKKMTFKPTGDMYVTDHCDVWVEVEK